MRILLEGPDASGKSFLGNMLCESLRLEYIHNDYTPNEKIYRESVKDCLSFVENNFSVLVDRFLPSEIAYGNVMRDGEVRYTIDSPEFADMMKHFDRIIFCLPHDIEHYLKSFVKSSETRDEYVRNVKDIKRIYNEYELMYIKIKNAYPEYAHKLTKYDYTHTLPIK